MKTRDLILPLVIIPLGAAFVLICVLLFFYGGRHSSLLKAKLRLGAFLLSFTFLAACSGPPTRTCYKPATPDNTFYLMSPDTISQGDSIKGSAYGMLTYPEFSWELVAKNGNVVVAHGVFNREGTNSKLADNRFFVERSKEWAKGAYTINIYGVENGNEKALNLFSRPVVLK